MSFVVNKKANLNYEIKDTFEAGLELLGTEVKSIRKGHGNIDNAYAIIRGGELYLVGASIPPYQIKNTAISYDPERIRKILMNKKEIAKIYPELNNLTLFATSLYSKGTKIKLGLALGKGKKKYDKRESLKKKAIDRDMARDLKR